MAKCKCGRGGCARIVSNVVQNMNQCGCVDICANPVCGDPDVLSIMAPLIYDEIGVNLCATFGLGTTIPTAYATAVTASAQVLGITYDVGNGVEIEGLAGRANCYVVTLSNLSVLFAVRLYDAACRLVGTVYPTAVYLPPNTTDATYDADTNPTSVELEIFAPYGLSYVSAEGATNPTINNLGFLDTNNTIRQGLNLYAIPKILDFSTNDSTITVGLTLILQSLYFAGYNVASAGKIQTPKGSIMTPDNSDCMRFVAGDLLDFDIKPRELRIPSCDTGSSQEFCSNNCNCSNGGSCNNQCGSCPAVNYGGCKGNCCSHFATDATVTVGTTPAAPAANT